MTVQLLEWDMDDVPGFVDATCDVHGLTTDAGNPDEHMDFDVGHAVVQLDNTSGDWSRYTLNGTQALHGPGFELAIWALELDGSSWWMFRGVISRWDESLDGTVTVEAFDAFATLAQPIGTYLPGVGGQAPGPRLAAIMATAGRATMPTRFDTGDVTLTAQSTEAAPLEEMQSVASSDGGALFPDADGAVVFMRRNYRNGRGDQVVFPVASDNVCTAPIEVWDAILSTNDDGLANTVIFENVAKLRALAPAGSPITGSVWTETDHQWTTQLEGDTIAAIVYGANNDPRVNIDEFLLYLFDPQQPELFHAVEWRLLDMLRFIHDTRAVGGGFNRLDVNTLVTSISHDVTPNQWIMTIGTAKAQSPNAVLVWNPPGDVYAWNSANAVWGY